ncbi:dTDP-4-dehydrorhamnose 3,5-epimerase [Myxococcaceae bacterium]|jgi:dTDP-4-dehydrorhamnose 3,5-epimerase|nr:dTDP-4-dehydrorhamnose 3,5-epimerase [Myxococcaceae bacterium]
MKVIETEIPGVLVVEPKVFRDPRGFFVETYHADRYRAAGIDAVFVQDNHSKSERGTLRGLHAQEHHPQAKLVRVIEGEIFDVAVDIRVGSPTFGRHVSVTLGAGDQRQIYVPVGFAHGFCVLSETAQVEYKCTDFYHPEDELRVLWNDPEIAIRWPIEKPLLSEKDAGALPLRSLHPRLPRLRP